MADRFRTPRKEKQWGSIPGFAINLDAFGTFVTAGLGFTSKQTVLRMLGSYCVAPRATLAAGDEATVTVGIGRVSTDAFTVGATAMPDPAGEPEYPWLYWAAHRFMFTGTDAEQQAQGIAAALRHDFDIRSMRKFSPGETLAFIVQAADVTGAPPMDIGVTQTRCLLTIH